MASVGSPGGAEASALRRILQQAGPVEDFQAQREELLVGYAAVGRCHVGSDEAQP